MESNIIIFCSDPRVVKWLKNNDVQKELSIDKGYSAISATGSVKFYLNENLMDKLIKQLKILTHHFSPEKIILLNHTDCGYYKSLGQDKEEIYLADLQTVGVPISDKFPDIKVEEWLMNTETGNLKQV